MSTTHSHSPAQSAQRPVDNIFVAQGTLICIPIAAINMSEELWGSDTHKFDRKRWLDSKHDEGGGGRRWTEIPGYKHMLTFGYGPRMCLGRNFALTEIKVRGFSISPCSAPVVVIIPHCGFQMVLSILVRYFSFELPDGPSTKFDLHHSFLMRLKVAGEEGPKVPLVVRPVGL